MTTRKFFAGALALALMLTASAFALQKVAAGLPEIGGRPVGGAVKARRLAVSALAVGQDSRDMALAALYNRLFALQDLRRGAEYRVDEAELAIEDLFKAYKKLDRFVGSVEELKKIASNPDHRRYPNNTQSSRLKILAIVLGHIRTQKLAGLDIKRIERDIANAERMIQDHLNRKA